MALADEYDVLVFDLDGTIYTGGKAIDHVVDAVNHITSPAYYVTNNASRSPETVAEQLRRLGLDVSSASVLTSAQAAVGLMNRDTRKGAPVLVLGSRFLQELVTEAGYRVVYSADDEPVVVVHGHSPETGWAELSEAALAIRRGALYIATNLDTTLPMERGLHVGNGSMVAAVSTATGVVPRSAGKPAPTMFHAVVQMAQAQRPLSVGDRLDTDIAASVAANIPCLQVMTGVSRHYATLSAPAKQRADYLAADMRALAASAAESNPYDPRSHGYFRVSFNAASSQLVIDGEASVDDPSEASMQALRAAACAVWSESDEAHPLTADNITAGSTAAASAVEHWR